MYIYPDNLKAKARLWMWTLRDMCIIGIGLLLSILILSQTGITFPLAVVCAYAFLSIQLDDVSIRDYIVWVWKFLISNQQYYQWEVSNK